VRANAVIFREIIWLDHIVDKLAWKHHVVPAEVEQVLESPQTQHYRNQKGKIEGEDIFNALGRTEAGRYLSIFYIAKPGERALIISARDMKSVERRRYGKK
jgi:uncharacterized DUF497 family protein